MVLVLMRIIVSVLMLGLLGWLVPHSLKERLVQQEPAEVLRAAPGDFTAFPEAQYLFGSQAFLEGRLDAAERFLKGGLARNVADVDAWLKLAEVEIAKGDDGAARGMLRLVTDLTPEVLRWKWQQALLARDLGLVDVFAGSLNTLVRAGQKVNDAFWLMETEDRQNTALTLEKLWPENREAYLRWLMRWSRPDDAVLAWKALDATLREDVTLRPAFIHFLMGNRKMQLAQELWLPSADPAGVTNPGFEQPLTRTGFDWRFSDREKEWQVHETSFPVHSGQEALEIRFSGEANCNFSHLYQFLPVAPGGRYRMTLWWKSYQLSSDQGPFVEILGKDCKGLYARGPMLLGTEDWRRVALEFEVPEGCETALIRVRRLPSRRFDNKLNGTLWLDDFALQQVGKP